VGGEFHHIPAFDGARRENLLALFRARDFGHNQSLEIVPLLYIIASRNLGNRLFSRSHEVVVATGDLAA
jgi:hypothetical protein